MDQLQFYYDYIISAVVFILLLTWMQHRQHTLVSLITIYPAIVTIIRILGLIIMIYYYTMTTVLWFHRACNTWSISIPVLSITAIYMRVYSDVDVYRLQNMRTSLLATLLATWRLRRLLTELRKVLRACYDWQLGV